MEDKEKQVAEPSRRPRKKKSRGHGGHHGGAWKVAYADFVTAMMALFLVLWLVSQADTQLKEQIANYFRSPGVFSSTSGGILPGKQNVSREPNKLSASDEDQALFGIASELKKKFSTQPEFGKGGDKVAIEVVEEGLQIEILDEADNVSFEVGSSQLNEQARKIIEEIAAAICELPNPIKIGGHTDRRVFPSSTGYTNWELSTDRANSARRVLVNACVDPKQILRIIGFADTDPIIENDVYHPANRRISITVVRLNPIKGRGAVTDSASPDVIPGNEPPKQDKGDQRLRKMRENIEREKADSKDAKKGKPEKESEKNDDSSNPKNDIASSKSKKSISVGVPDKIPKAPTRKEGEVKP